VKEAREFDAIVVGSGISGGWAAKELTERGLTTLVLEAGGPIDPERDYVEHVPPYAFPFRVWGDRTPFRREQPVQSETDACGEAARKFFVNDIDNPYTHPDDAPFRWIRGRQVGGRSITWGRQVYRWSDLDFEANARDGHGNDWPIRYADIAPWYSHVERFIGVSGAPEGLAQLPDGEFLPPMPMTDVEHAARERIHKAFGGERLVTIGRVAVLTRNHNGRAACHYCGPCERGCITHSYFSSIGSTLPAARATGRLTLRPHSVVAGLTYDAKRSRVGGVRVVDAITLRETEYKARVVFLCASAIESVRLLLNSKSARSPDGMANSSGTLGRYVMDHHFGSGATGRMRGFDDRKTFGRRPNGIYIAFSQCPLAAPGVPARLRHAGQRGTKGLAPRRQRAGLRSGLQALADHRAGSVDIFRPRFWRDLAACRQPRDDRPEGEGQMGHSGRAHRGTLAGQRGGDGKGHGDQHGRDARGRRLHRDQAGAGELPARILHPRNGRGAHEPDAGGRGTERPQPGLGRVQPVHHRWRMHGELRMPESEHHLHGAHGTRGRIRGIATAASRVVNSDRRDFLALSGFALGSLALPRSVGAASVDGSRIDSIGVQLYSVRRLLRDDFIGTLSRVAAIGYREVEFAGLMQHKAANVRRALDRLGLTAPSMHIPFETLDAGWGEVIDDARTLGCTYLVVPSLPGTLRTSLDSYRRVADRFNRAAEAAKKSGLRFAYHNHAVDFAPVDRRVPYDVLLEATDASLVDIELDLYWILRAGHDPRRYFNRWPGRCKLVHVKDSLSAPEYRMTDVGAGIIDWPGILAAARNAGTEHFIVEHDDAVEPLASIATSFRYLRNLRLPPAPPRRGRLKQSIARWTAKDVPLTELCQRVKAIGYDAIDLLAPDEWGTVRASGLACSLGYAVRRDRFIQNGFNDPANHPMLLAELEAGIPLAAKAGVPNLIAMFGNRHGTREQDDVASCVAGLSRIAPLAEQHGVTICVELLNSKIDHAGYEGDHTAFGVDVVQAVGSVRVKLLYDIYHMQIMEGDVIRTIRDSIPWIGHFHTGGVPGRHEIDASQELNYRAVAKAIADTGFAGYVAHEFVPVGEPFSAFADAFRIFDV
jgi:sugar phosphate isomerase/epimerase